MSSIGSRSRTRTPTTITWSKDRLNDRKTSLQDSLSRSVDRQQSTTPNVFRMMKQMYKYMKLSSKEHQQATALEKLRRIARLILICVSWCRFSVQRAEENKEKFLSLTQFTDNDHDEPMRALDGQDLLFDVSYFKTNKEQKLPQEAKRILQKPCDTRSERELKYLLLVLRSSQTFAEYPVRMQKMLCKVGWYEGYNSKRVIVRQGHPPHAFYFILSGTVVITVLEDHSSIPRTLCFLYRGMEFGELALISRSIRQATVLSKTSVELLCISVEDFEEIFMSGGIKNVNDPDHNAFMRNIPFLKLFPLETLTSDACVFHYFNRGQVLVKDSKYSDWIYIVKSGSVSVMKKLLDVKAKQAADLKRGKNKDKQPRKLKSLKHQRSVTWPSHRETTKKQEYTTPYEMKKKLEQSLVGYLNQNDRLGIIDYDSVIEEYERKVFQDQDPLPPIKEDLQLPPIKTEQKITETQPSQRNEYVKLPNIQKTKTGAYMATGRSKRKTSDTDQVKYKDDNYVLVSGRKTIADDLDNKPIKLQPLTDADLYPTFIQVQVLERGQYFGVGDIIYGDQPSLSLVSNGADCILISKKLFTAHCNDAIIRHLRETEVPFPSEEEMQTNLQNYISWKEHRSNTYKTSVNKAVTKRHKKKWARPQYIGQYDFRTGPI